MSLEVNLYSFSKRRNSTARPSGDGHTVELFFKEPTSYRSFNARVHEPRMPYNYMHWGGWYYWIEDIVSEANNLFSFKCVLDELATYKDYILNTTAFIEYDTSQNLELPDGRIPPKVTPIVKTASKELTSALNKTGTCIVTVQGEKTVGSYPMTNAQASSILTNLDNWVNKGMPESEGDTLEEIFKNFISQIQWQGKQAVGTGSAPDKLKMCTWIPWTVTGDVSEKVKLGFYDTGITAARIVNRNITYGIQIEIPWAFTDWRRNSPYTELYLHLPFIGVIHLNASNFIGYNSLSVTCCLDKITGDISYMVRTSDLGEIVGTYGASTGVLMPIGSSNVDIGKEVTSLIGGVASAAMGNPLGAGMGLLSGLTALVPNQTTIGGISGCSTNYVSFQTVYCYTVSHDTIAEPASVTAVMGTPYMKTDKIGNHTGYVKTNGASVSAPALAGILDSINKSLDGGVYIE